MVERFRLWLQRFLGIEKLQLHVDVHMASTKLEIDDLKRLARRVDAETQTLRHLVLRLGHQLAIDLEDEDDDEKSDGPKRAQEYATWDPHLGG